MDDIILRIMFDLRVHLTGSVWTQDELRIVEISTASSKEVLDLALSADLLRLVGPSTYPNLHAKASSFQSLERSEEDRGSTRFSVSSTREKSHCQ